MEHGVTFSSGACEQFRRVLPALAAALPLLLPTRGSCGADPVPDVATEQRQASKLSGLERARLTLRRAGEAGAAFEATGESLLKWSNPDAGRVYGDVYLWTDMGRPAVLASIYRWYSPYQSLTIEFCSLSTEAVTAERGGETIWNPDQAGITWRELRGVDPPSQSRPARLTQMKRIANQFTAKLSDARSDQASVDKVLRQLSRPVFRYGTAALTDGAIFGFVVGTDPELLLLIEANGTGWQYALARFNRDPLSVLRDGELVQEFDYIPPADLSAANRPYACYVVKDVQLTETAP